MKTIDIFKGENISYRDSGIDSWLKEEYPDEEVGEYTVHKNNKVQTLRETFAEVTDNLKEHCFTPKQIEDLINEDKVENWNFFPVIDNYGDVSVVFVGRNGRRWHVDVFRLDRGGGWRAGGHLFLRNKKLVPSDTKTATAIVENKLTITIPKGFLTTDIKEYSEGEEHKVEIGLIAKEDMCTIRHPHSPCKKCGDL